MLNAQSWEGCCVAAGLLCWVPSAQDMSLLEEVSLAPSVVSAVGTTALATVWP